MSKHRNCGGELHVIYEYTEDSCNASTETPDELEARTGYSDANEMPEEVYNEEFVTAWRETGSVNGDIGDEDTRIEWDEKEQVSLEEIDEDTLVISCDKCHQKLAEYSIEQIYLPLESGLVDVMREFAKNPHGTRAN